MNILTTISQFRSKLQMRSFSLHGRISDVKSSVLIFKCSRIYVEKMLLRICSAFKLIGAFKEHLKHLNLTNGLKDS